jgi:8-oxo-dGTP pyrophosphatase MutT (NUDIX family)
MHAPFVLDQATVRSRLSRGLAPPEGTGPAWAATALVVADGPGGPSLCFIERAERPGDRWSGQMALPGGKRDPGDPDLVHTAVRESHEEVGLELADVAPVGRLGDIRGRAHKGRVATFVWCLDHQPALTPDPGEVQAALWIPLRHLLDPASATRYRWGGIGAFPGIHHEGRVIWGLTHRILETFVDVLEHELPRAR